MIYWTPIHIAQVGDKEINLEDVKYFTSISSTHCSAYMSDGSILKIEISFDSLKAFILSELPDTSADNVGVDVYNIAQISSLKDSSSGLIVRWQDSTYSVIEAENIDSVIGFINGISGFSGSDGGDGTDGGNPFDQDLNTFNLPKFAGLGTLTKTDAPGATGNSVGSVMIAGAGNNTSFSSYDVFIVYEVGSSMATGDRNVAIGYTALKNMTSGWGNIVIGDEAAYQRTGGNHNVVLGTNAGYSNKSGANNVFIGNSAGYGFNSISGNGYENVAIGWSAGFALDTAAGNVLIGRDAGAQIDEGGWNTIIGWDAGNAVTSGDDNTFIGESAGNNVTTGSKNIAIGYNATPLNSNATNKCILGGTGSYAVYVGINNKNPLYRLDVGGDINFTGSLYKNGVILETGGGGVTDHGGLTGLSDDDHTQYFNTVRGDARYSLIHSHPYAVDTHSHNDLYYTEAEVDALLTGLGGGGAVDSVNGYTGVVILDAADVSAEPANANIQTHIGSAHAPSDAQKNSNITKEEIEAKLTGEITSHTHIGGGATNVVESFLVAVSDELADLEVGTEKVTFRMPYDFQIQKLKASLTTACTGAAIQVDIKRNGTTILSSYLTIDDGSKTSVGSISPATISDSYMADDDEMTIDIIQVGSTVVGSGLKVTFIGIQIPIPVTATPYRFWRLYIPTQANVPSVSEIEMATSLSGSDQCSGGTAIAESAYGGWPASAAFDNSTTTNWTPSHLDGVTTWIGYDFGEGNEKAIQEVRIRGRNSYAVAQAIQFFDLQYSDNGTDYTTLWSTGTAPVEGTYTTYNAETLVSQRRWRLNVSAVNGYNLVLMAEIEFRSVAGVEELGTSGGNHGHFGTEWVSNWSPDKAFNNVLSDYWASDGIIPAQIGTVYSEAKTVAQVAIKSGSAVNVTGMPKDFTVEYSDNGGANWTVAGTFTDSTGWSLNETRTFNL